MTKRSFGVIAVAFALGGCGGGGQSGADRAHQTGASPAAASKPLRIAKLRGAVVRMGSLRGEPLYGVRLRALLCTRSRADANRTVPMSYRIAHYVTRGRASRKWGQPFRVLDNDVYWLVTLGETTNTACRGIPFEDVIPPVNYGGVESPLGVLGHSTLYHCYGVRFTLRAFLSGSDNRISASKRAIVRCGRFLPG